MTFRYDTELQTFERASGSLGPVYVERPQTVGRGKLDMGFWISTCCSRSSSRPCRYERAQCSTQHFTPDPNDRGHEFPGGTNVRHSSIDDDGDLLLRTKYHFLSSNGLNLASGLSLRLPTGDENDFQGLDDVVLTPYLAMSHEYGRFDFHLQAGVDINADDTERSRVRYGAGMTVQMIEQVAFLLDIIGSSNVTDQDISVKVPVIIGSQEVGTQTIAQELRIRISSTYRLVSRPLWRNRW